MIKKTCLVLVILFLGIGLVRVSNAYAAYAAASLDPNADWSQINVNGVWEDPVDVSQSCTDKAVGCVWTNPDTGTSLYIVRDLAELQPGQYTLIMRWGNFDEIGPESDPLEYTRRQWLEKPSMIVIE